jgi:hypothetical protein
MPFPSAVRALPVKHPVVHALHFDTDFATEVRDFPVWQTETSHTSLFAGAVGIMDQVMLRYWFALKADSAMGADFFAGSPSVFDSAFLSHESSKLPARMTVMLASSQKIPLV